MDYTLHEWVRMASHHGSIARCAIEKQAEESGLDALAVREKMRHHLRVMQEAAQQGLDERLRSVTGLTGGQAALMMKRLQAGKCLEICWARRKCTRWRRRSATAAWAKSSLPRRRARAGFCPARCWQ